MANKNRNKTYRNRRNKTNGGANYGMKNNSVPGAPPAAPVAPPTAAAPPAPAAAAPKTGGNRRNKTKRNRTNGGGSCGGMKNNGMPPATMGGKRRKTHKMSKGADAWREGVMRVFKEMKAKDKNASFSAALKEASKRKKAGTL